MPSGKMLAALLASTCLLAPAAFAQETVTIQFWEGHSVQEEQATINMIAAFEAAHPDIKVERVKTSFGTNFERITTAIASNTAPDVSPIWSGFLTQFAEQGQLVDLTQYGVEPTNADIYPGAFDYVTWNDGVYGLPYAFDPRFIVYNQEAFEAAGLTEPPATFEELIEYTEQLTVGEGSNIEQYGFGLGGSDSLAYFFINLLYAYGGQVFNEDGTEAVFNNEAGLQAGEIISRLAGLPGATLNAGEGLRQSVLHGRVAMIYDGPWIFYEALNDPESEEFGIGRVPMPGEGDQPLNFGSVGAYVVYEQSDNKEAAAEFVKFLASPEAQQHRVAMLKPGVSPGVRDAPEAQAAFEEWPGLETAQNLLDESRIFPKHDNWPSVFQAIIPAVEAIIGGEDPQSALDAAVNQANRALRRG
ncbi:ABC transporter substrate-binding protein [Devosia nitrariae]|uniref:Sugar ABC transporter substrate-binding protein n=1 Tax=Devosia nitrariae TaxID=2071872 RepID=A0ABQ5WCI1_9HYPH|nr:sugar ABC transporter substrate-binding protein [Devosia nitrariae]GLQ57657.1 sugar ABC transporter substrate-binding protein [Devosia nitrariae]